MIPNATIVVTGGTGFLGASALPALCRNLPVDASIVSVARRNLLKWRPDNVIEVCASLEDFELYEAALAAADYVLWMAADRRHDQKLPALWPVNVEAVGRAVCTLRKARRLRRIIYVSTISVLDQAERPSRILDQNSLPAPITDYGRSKLLAEQVLLNSGLPVTILRLPFLYGPGHAEESFLAWYWHLASGSAMARVNYTARLSLLYAADLGHIAANLIKDAVHQDDESSCYLVSDGQVYSVNHLIDLVCRLRGTNRPACLPELASGGFSYMLAPTRWGYWRHAAFDPNFFVVDSSVFQRRFPSFRYTELEAGLRASFPIAGTKRSVGPNKDHFKMKNVDISRHGGRGAQSAAQ